MILYDYICMCECKLLFIFLMCGWMIPTSLRWHCKLVKGIIPKWPYSVGGIIPRQWNIANFPHNWAYMCSAMGRLIKVIWMISCLRRERNGVIYIFTLWPYGSKCLLRKWLRVYFRTLSTFQVFFGSIVILMDIIWCCNFIFFYIYIYYVCIWCALRNRLISGLYQC